MKNLIRAFFVMSLVLTVSALAQTARSRPNMVIMLAADLGWGDPGCYNPQSKTPTRYALLTGWYAIGRRAKQSLAAKA